MIAEIGFYCGNEECTAKHDLQKTSNFLVGINLDGSPVIQTICSVCKAIQYVIFPQTVLLERKKDG